MPDAAGDFDEFGLKVQRAQSRADAIRGKGTVDGITVEVDAENRLVQMNHPDAHSIIAAYQAALRDKQPQFDDVLRDVLEDPRAQAISTFVRANTEAAAARRPRARSDDEYFDDFRRDPLGRNR